MTIDAERLRKIAETEKFLERLGYRGVNGKYELTKLGEIREFARQLLHHFPEPWWIDQRFSTRNKAPKG